MGGRKKCICTPGEQCFHCPYPECCANGKAQSDWESEIYAKFVPYGRGRRRCLYVLEREDKTLKKEREKKDEGTKTFTEKFC